MTHFTSGYFRPGQGLIESNGMSMGRGKEGLARGERLQIMLSPDELAAVDDFRFKNRMPSRAAAVRELFRLGLASVGLVKADGRKSADFGVLGAEHSSRGNGNVVS